MKILILGATGFLGAELVNILRQEQNQLLLVGKRPRNLMPHHYVSTQDLGLIAQIKKFSPEIVINAMGSWGDHLSSDELFEANFGVALRIFNELQNNLIHWVQCNSYFNYTFDETNEDRNLYSMYRRKFVDYSMALSENSNVRFSEIRLPHLVGGTQPQGRLIQLAAHSLKTNQALDLGSGSQILPLLHVVDAARQIVWIAMQSCNIPGYFLFASEPLCQMSVREIMDHLIAVSGRQAVFNFSALSDRRQENYEKIKFNGEKLVMNNVVSIGLDQILNEYFRKDPSHE